MREGTAILAADDAVGAAREARALPGVMIRPFLVDGVADGLRTLRRRGVATHLGRAGVSVPAVQASLGHRQLETAARYVEVEREELGRAAERGRGRLPALPGPLAGLNVRRLWRTGRNVRSSV